MAEGLILEFAGPAAFRLPVVVRELDPAASTMPTPEARAAGGAALRQVGPRGQSRHFSRADVGLAIEHCALDRQGRDRTSGRKAHVPACPSWPLADQQTFGRE